MAIVTTGLDAVAQSNTYRFLRCVHWLLESTCRVDMPDATRQVEYFFVGEWE
jgi:hypothetical protein